jgi:hypothetical protein
MKKIDITAGSTSGDNGPIAGEKLNDNFKELVLAAFGSDIWDGNVDEAVSLASLPTNNKSSLFAAISEVYAKAANIDDSLATSLFKTWSIDKLLATFIDQTELDAALAALVASAPGTLDTLNELAAALGDDPNFATTIAAALGLRLRIDVANQGLSTTQKTNALTNLGISAKEIIASGAVFAWHKKPSNSTATLAATEIITNGRISDTIHIKSAEYVSGDINTFGTLAGFFKDGSYKKVEYRNF